MAGGQSSRQADKQKLADGQAYRFDVIKNFTNNFYDPRNPCSFSTYEKLYRRAKTQSGVELSAVKSWLEQQDAYTLHKPVRKQFPRNPYTVNNIMDLWEADLVDVQSPAKHNDGHRGCQYTISRPYQCPRNQQFPWMLFHLQAWWGSVWKE